MSNEDFFRHDFHGNLRVPPAKMPRFFLEIRHRCLIKGELWVNPLLRSAISWGGGGIGGESSKQHPPTHSYGNLRARNSQPD